jgi:hypothetical protein
MEKSSLKEYILIIKVKKRILEKNIVWYDNGQIHVEGTSKKGVKDGSFVSYWKNGQLKRKYFYKKGALIEGKCWNIAGEEVAFYDFEIQPEFPDGKEALLLYHRKNINYTNFPTSRKGKSIKVSFYIDKDGCVVDVSVIMSLNSYTNYEVKRVIENMSKWNPDMMLLMLY